MIPCQCQCIVSTGWLAEHLADPNLAILDASWHMPAEKRDAGAEFFAGHIPGAQFFDIDKIADTSQDLPHMLPSDQVFEHSMATMGIGNKTHVVIYDAKGVFSAPRVWWTLLVLGATHVSVLDGGLPKWKAEGRALEAGPARSRSPVFFRVRRNLTAISSLDDMRNSLMTGREQIVDARSAARFTGEQPEPRAGLMRGHIPGARNVPFSSLVNPDGTMKPAAELRVILNAAGVIGSGPVVASCGSGITAAVVVLGMALCGLYDTAVYDGSWAEWGRDPANPVAAGPA